MYAAIAVALCCCAGAAGDALLSRFATRPSSQRTEMHQDCVILPEPPRSHTKRHSSCERAQAVVSSLMSGKRTCLCALLQHGHEVLVGGLGAVHLQARLLAGRPWLQAGPCSQEASSPQAGWAVMPACWAGPGACQSCPQLPYKVSFVMQASRLHELQDCTVRLPGSRCTRSCVWLAAGQGARLHRSRGQTMPACWAGHSHTACQCCPQLPYTLALHAHTATGLTTAEEVVADHSHACLRQRPDLLVELRSAYRLRSERSPAQLQAGHVCTPGCGGTCCRA